MVSWSGDRVTGASDICSGDAQAPGTAFSAWVNRVFLAQSVIRNTGSWGAHVRQERISGVT